MLPTVRRTLTHLAALAVLGGLVAVAEAYLEPDPLVIVAPADVYGGNPINGYVTNIDGWAGVNGTDQSGQKLQNSPVTGYQDPMWFSFPTFEYMAPSLATIMAHDADDMKSKQVLIK